MLHYDPRSYGGLPIIFQLVGSVYPKVTPQACFAAAVTLALKIAEDEDIVAIQDVFDHNYAYQIYTFILGFLLVFRCNTGYQRFWEARTTLEIMSTKWSIACMQSIVFDMYGEIKSDGRRIEERKAYRYRICSLFSLLSATALANVHESKKHTKFDVLEGINKKQALESIHGKEVKSEVYLAYTWVQDVLTRRRDEGGLSIPPPIASRIFQELSEGMLGYANAAKIDATPFPFPYAQLIELSLAIMMVTIPFVVNDQVEGLVVATFIAGGAVAGYYSVNEVAKILEEPFGHDMNDLPLQQYQKEFNARIASLVHLNEFPHTAPPLVPDHIVMGFPQEVLTELEQRRAAMDEDENRQMQEKLRASQLRASEDDEPIDYADVVMPPLKLGPASPPIHAPRQDDAEPSLDLEPVPTETIQEHQIRAHNSYAKVRSCGVIPSTARFCSPNVTDDELAGDPVSRKMQI